MGFDQKPDSLVTVQLSFHRRSSYPTKRIKNRHRRTRLCGKILRKNIAHELGRESGDPRNPTMNWSRFIICESGILESAIYLAYLRKRTNRRHAHSSHVVLRFTHPND